MWRHPVGDAWSSFSIVGQRLFTQEQRGPLECVVSYDAETGAELWRHEDTARYETAQGGIGPRATPTVTKDAVFAVGATGILNALDPRRVWPRNRNMKLKFNEAVQLGDHVDGPDDGILACVDVTTGKRTWKGGRYRYGQILLWGDKLIVQAEAGYVAVVEAAPAAFREVTRLEALHDRTWNMPMINRTRLYTRNASEAVCYELPSM